MVACKADKSTYGPEVQDAVIEISAKVPPFACETAAKVLEDFYLGEARKIETVLHDTLPGATYERVAGLMLQQMAGILRVPFGDGQGVTDEQP